MPSIVGSYATDAQNDIVRLLNKVLLANPDQFKKSFFSKTLTVSINNTDKLSVSGEFKGEDLIWIDASVPVINSLPQNTVASYGVQLAGGEGNPLMRVQIIPNQMQNNPLFQTYLNEPNMCEASEFEYIFLFESHPEYEAHIRYIRDAIEGVYM